MGLSGKAEPIEKGRPLINQVMRNADPALIIAATTLWAIIGFKDDRRVIPRKIPCIKLPQETHYYPKKGAAMNLSKCVFLLMVTHAIVCAQNRVEVLAPPCLKKEAIAKKIACVRPMRKGMFNISTEEIDGKFVVHCYGHGGSGWSTFLGSIEHAISLFQKQYPLQKNTPPIRVIGSGCMGMGSAIELSRRGYTVAGITTKELYDIASWKAGGDYGLVSLQTSPEHQQILNEINFFTFRAYQLIEKGEHPYFSSKTVRFIPFYAGPGCPSGVEELEELGMIPPRESVDIDFGNGVIHRDFTKFMTYYADVTGMMQEMHNEVAKRVIPIEMKDIKSFGEISESIVFNCTGLGSKELVKDNLMVPIRGHLLLLNEQAGQGHMTYMLGAEITQDGRSEEIYLIPKNGFVSKSDGQCDQAFGVIGGTYIPDADTLSPEDLVQLDEQEFERLFMRNYEFFYGIGQSA